MQAVWQGGNKTGLSDNAEGFEMNKVNTGEVKAADSPEEYERIWLRSRRDPVNLNAPTFYTVNPDNVDFDFPPVEYVRADIAKPDSEDVEAAPLEQLTHECAKKIQQLILTDNFVEDSDRARDDIARIVAPYVNTSKEGDVQQALAELRERCPEFKCRQITTYDAEPGAPYTHITLGVDDEHDAQESFMGHTLGDALQRVREWKEANQ